MSNQEDEWSEAMAHLRAYSQREGHARVPRAHVEAGFRLGHWVNNQRAWRRNSRLSAARQRELEDVDGWVWDPFEQDWLEGLARLREYIAREGHALVAEAHVESGFKLGAWVRQRRTEQRDGRLAPDRSDALAALPGWTISPHEAKFRKGIESLRAYCSETGHMRVPAKFVTSDGFRLGNWVVNQRQAHRRGKLPRERAVILESFDGWVWARHDAAWQEGLAHLRAYTVENGGATPPVEHVSEDGYPLGRWAAQRRSEYRASRLTRDKASTLEALSGWVSAVTEAAGIDHDR